MKRAPLTTIETLARLPRNARSRIDVTLDESKANGSRFVNICRLQLNSAGQWIAVRGVSLQLDEVGAVSAALTGVRRAGDGT